VIRRTGTYGDLPEARFDHLYTIYPSGEIFIDRNVDFTADVSSTAEHLRMALDNPGTPPWTESEQDATPTSDWIGGYSNDATYKVDPFMVLYEDWTGVNANVSNNEQQHRVLATSIREGRGGLLQRPAL
jgi:hypothetical protein